MEKRKFSLKIHCLGEMKKYFFFLFPWLMSFGLAMSLTQKVSCGCDAATFCCGVHQRPHRSLRHLTHRAVVLSGYQLFICCVQTYPHGWRVPKLGRWCSCTVFMVVLKRGYSSAIRNLLKHEELHATGLYMVHVMASRIGAMIPNLKKRISLQIPILAPKTRNYWNRKV